MGKKASKKDTPHKNLDFLESLQVSLDDPHYKVWKNFCSKAYEANYRGLSEHRRKLISGETPDPRSHVPVFVAVYDAAAEGQVALVTDEKSAEVCGQELENCLTTCLELFKKELEETGQHLTTEESRRALKDLRWRLLERLDLAKAEALKAARLHDASAETSQPKAYKTALAGNIDRLRKECGWSFDDLANAAELDKKLIIRHVKHGKKAHPSTLERYAQTFTEKVGSKILVADLEK